jgi:hypothetical protein
MLHQLRAGPEDCWYGPRDAQRGVSQQSNWRESVLHGSQVCIRQREPFLTPNRGKVELIG